MPNGTMKIDGFTTLALHYFDASPATEMEDKVIALMQADLIRAANDNSMLAGDLLGLVLVALSMPTGSGAVEAICAALEAGPAVAMVAAHAANRLRTVAPPDVPLPPNTTPPW